VNFLATGDGDFETQAILGVDGEVSVGAEFFASAGFDGSLGERVRA
jgi:hypothetical protein